MKKVGYAKLGRSIPLDDADLSSVGGDIEVVNLFHRLRRDYEVHLIGRNRTTQTWPDVVNHWGPGGLFDDIPTLRNRNRGDGYVDNPDNPSWKAYVKFMDDRIPQLPKLDAVVIWLGQHGTSCSFLPKVKGEGYAIPQQSAANYLFPLVRILNLLDIQPIWLCPDPRNTLKFRDLSNMKQRPILAQYNDLRSTPFWNLEKGTHYNKIPYKYSGIELLAVQHNRGPNALAGDSRKLFGILVNEGRTGKGSGHRVTPRLSHLKYWVAWNLDLRYDEHRTSDGRLYGQRFRGTKEWHTRDWEIKGHWSEDSMVELARLVEPVPINEVHETLQGWKSTITFPANQTGWATAKPWECFAAGTICFKHPKYDDQHNIYSKQHMPEGLQQFLSPKTPWEFQDRVKTLEDYDTWYKWARLQHDYLVASRTRLDFGAKEVVDAIERF